MLYHTYHLFDDVEDRNLRIKNRSTVLVNIMEDNLQKSEKGKEVSEKGARVIFGYFAQIPPDERGEVMNGFQQELARRGYSYAN